MSVLLPILLVPEMHVHEKDTYHQYDRRILIPATRAGLIIHVHLGRTSCLPLIIINGVLHP